MAYCLLQISRKTGVEAWNATIATVPTKIRVFEWLVNNSVNFEAFDMKPLLTWLYCTGVQLQL